MNQIIHNQITVDIHELKEDIKAGMFSYLGAEIYWLRALKNITEKIGRQNIKN